MFILWMHEPCELNITLFLKTARPGQPRFILPCFPTISQRTAGVIYSSSGLICHWCRALWSLVPFLRDTVSHRAQLGRKRADRHGPSKTSFMPPTPLPPCVTPSCLFSARFSTHTEDGAGVFVVDTLLLCTHTHKHSLRHTHKHIYIFHQSSCRNKRLVSESRNDRHFVSVNGLLQTLVWLSRALLKGGGCEQGWEHSKMNCLLWKVITCLALPSAIWDISEDAIIVVL